MSSRNSTTQTSRSTSITMRTINRTVNRTTLGVPTRSRVSTVSFASNASFVPFGDIDWIFSEVILLISFLSMFVMFVGLLIYLVNVSMEPKGRLRKKRSVYLYLLCMLALFVAIVRNLVTQAVAFFGWYDQAICNIGVRLSYGLYFLAMMTIFMFLWFRQLVFYTNSLLSQFIHPVIAFGSWMTLVVMLSGGTFLILIFSVPRFSDWRYVATPYGCRNVSANANHFIPKLFIYFTVFMHVVLLMFFLFPLLYKKTKPYSTGNIFDIDFDLSDSGTGASNNEKLKYGKAEEQAQQQLRLEQGERIITFIYRMCVLTLMCVGVDVAITSGQFLISSQSELIFLSLFDLNLLVNITCNISTFQEWLHMICPCCFRRKKKKKTPKPAASEPESRRKKKVSSLRTDQAKAQNTSKNYSTSFQDVNANEDEMDNTKEDSPGYYGD